MTQLPVDADAALKTTVTDVLAGPLLEDSKPSYELLHYTTGMSNPLARITTNPAKRLNPVSAVARFVWMVAASDRVEDIAYYEPRVRDYSDNEISVPGSSYGRRLFESNPGLNQIQGVVERLTENPASRRAAAVVWSPVDATRKSADIPCAFGMFFHIRGDGLIASTVMRSNNAFALLPFNVFEFSVLAEVVAASAGVPLVRYVHWAASMHVYTDNFQLGSSKKIAEGPGSTSIEMPPVPRDEPLDQIRQLALAEAKLRHASNADEFEAAISGAGLNEYWASYLTVLAAWGAHKRGWTERAGELAAALPDYFREDVLAKVTAAQEAPATATSDSDSEQLDLGLDLPRLSDTVPATAFGPNSPELVAQFEENFLGYLERNPRTVPAELVPKIRATLYERGDLVLAARSEWAEDGLVTAHLTDETITAVLDELTYP